MNSGTRILLNNDHLKDSDESMYSDEPDTDESSNGGEDDEEVRPPTDAEVP